MLSKKFGDQKVFGDMQLFVFGITGELYYFQTVAQGRRYGIQPVSGSNKNHVGQIKRNFQIIIGERKILLRVESFKQSRGRVASKVLPNFINFIQHENWVFVSDRVNALYNSARQSTDISPAVSPQLRFVMQTAQRNPDKFPAQSAGDGTAD